MAGLEYDRRWMLIDEANRFVSQRECPKMSLIRIELSADGIKVMSEDSSILIPYRIDKGDRVFTGLGNMD